MFSNSKRLTLDHRLIRVDNEDITDPKKIADAVVEHFTQKGTKLANSIQAERYALQSSNHSFDCHPTDPDEISMVITQLRNAAQGYDQVQAFILKSAVKVIVLPLSILINISLELGIVPLAL